MKTESVAEALNQRELLKILTAFKRGNFSVRMSVEKTGLAGKTRNPDLATASAACRFLIAISSDITPSLVQASGILPSPIPKLLRCPPG